MIELVETVHVHAHAEQAWAVLVDWDHQNEWMLGTSVRSTEQNGEGVDAGLHAVTGIGRFGMPDTMRITAWEAPHRCDVVHLGPIVRGTASFTVTPCEEPRGGVDIAWTEVLELPLPMITERLWPLIRPLVTVPFRVSLRRLGASILARTV